MAQLVRIQTCENIIEANLLKNILAEENISSFIENEQTIQSDWLLSQAVGGLYLQVFDTDYKKAKKLLEDFKNEKKQLLKVVHTIENPAFDFVCPKCNSNHIFQKETKDALFGISWLLIGIPIKTKSSTYSCYYCNHEFKHH